LNSYQIQSTTRHEYRLSGWTRGMLFIVGCIIAAASFAFGFVFRSTPDGFIGIPMAMLFLAIAAYLFAYAVRSRIVIDGSRITVRTAFAEKTADRSDILGFRALSTRNGTYKQLYLRDGRSPISISQNFSTDDDFHAWFAQLTDLDERDKQKLLDDIAHEPELGATPEERLAALANAKTWNVFAIIVTIAAAAALYWGEPPFRLPAAVVLALAPLAAIFLVQRSPLLYAVFKQKSDPRADLSFVFFASGFGLVFSTRELHFVSMQPLLMIAASVAIILFAALYISARNGFAVPGTLVAFLFISAFYGYGLAVTVDTLPDQSPPTHFAAQVVGKHVSRGRSTTYYLYLAPWGPIQGTDRISVPSAIYDRAIEGRQVCLELHAGALRIPWYKPVDCPYQPDWIAPE
jgi:hypothetical protein